MPLPSIIPKLGTFAVLSLYIIAIVLTFCLIVTITSGAVISADEIVWDDPSAVPSQIHPTNAGQKAIFPAGSFSGNKVSVTVDVDAHIAGAMAYFNFVENADVSLFNNKVFAENLQSSNILRAAEGIVFDGFGTAKAFGNYLEVRSSQVQDITGASVSNFRRDTFVPGKSYMEASGNEVHVFDTQVSQDVYGASAYIDYFHTGDTSVTGNKVYFENGNARTITGGHALATGSAGKTASALDNMVYVKDSSASWDIVGGMASGGAAGLATGNIVTLEGAVRADRDIKGGGFRNADQASDSWDYFSGNVLNVIRPQAGGIKAGGNLENFEEYNFVFSASSPDNTVCLSADGRITLNDGQSKGSIIKSITLLDDGALPAAKTNFVLFESAGTDIDYTNFIVPADSTQPFNALLNYDLAYTQAPRRLTVQVNNLRASDSTGIIPDGPSGGLDIINDGGDLILDPGDDGFDPLDDYGNDDGYDPLDDYGNDDSYDPLDEFGPDDGTDPLDRGGPGDGSDPLDRDGSGGGNSPLDREGSGDVYDPRDQSYMDRRQEVSRKSREDDKRRKREAAQARRRNPCPRVFFKAKAGQTKRNEDSDLTIKSFSALLGVDCGRFLDYGRITFGAAFEGGRGSYDTSRPTAGGTVRGSGDLAYTGGTVRGRFDFKPRRFGRFYLESSFRFGKLSSDFQTYDLAGAAGRKVSYDTDTPYIGLAFGAGDQIVLNQVSYLNVYAQYFWTRIKGDDIELNTGQKIEMEDMVSKRIRTGLQYHRALTPNWRIFAGGGFELETDGKTEARTAGHKLPSSSKKGGSGIFEMGVSYSTSTASPFKFSLAAQGFGGKRKGGAGVAQFSVVF